MNNTEPTILGKLRSLVPKRSLRFSEALRIVTLQAHYTRQFLDITSDEFPDGAIDEIPRVSISQEFDLPVSGLTQWHNGRWIIATNALEPWTRQRFSAAHELFHVINHTTRDWLHPGDPQRAEQLADWYAGSLLMPRMLLKRYAASGESPTELSERFGVSLPAIAVRLAQLGITEPTRRCATPSTSFNRAVRPYRQSPEGATT